MKRKVINSKLKEMENLQRTAQDAIDAALEFAQDNQLMCNLRIKQCDYVYVTDENEPDHSKYWNNSSCIIT